jgi:hypothetical protein
VLADYRAISYISFGYVAQNHDSLVTEGEYLLKICSAKKKLNKGVLYKFSRMVCKPQSSLICVSEQRLPAVC